MGLIKRAPGPEKLTSIKTRLTRESKEPVMAVVSILSLYYVNFTAQLWHDIIIAHLIKQCHRNQGVLKLLNMKFGCNSR